MAFIVGLIFGIIVGLIVMDFAYFYKSTCKDKEEIPPFLECIKGYTYYISAFFNKISRR